MTFRNVLERNFNSIFRRCLVWTPKPLFVDSAAIGEEYHDAALDGIFEKDSTLRAFLESGPAIAASLQHQHGFEARCSKEYCRKIIEEAATDGLTEVKVREACGLPPRQDWFLTHLVVGTCLSRAPGDLLARAGQRCRATRVSDIHGAAKRCGERKVARGPKHEGSRRAHSMRPS